MPNAINRPGRLTLAHGLAGAALLVACGFVPNVAAAQNAGQVQLAQASGQKPPARQAQPPADPVEAQIADLQKRLKITAAQQAQFDAFAQAIRQNSQEMNTLAQQEQQNTTRTAVEDLRTSAKMTQAEADGLKRLLPPLEALYAALSDQQKRTADQTFSNQQQQQQQPKKKG